MIPSSISRGELLNSPTSAASQSVANMVMPTAVASTPGGTAQPSGAAAHALTFVSRTMGEDGNVCVVREYLCNFCQFKVRDIYFVNFCLH